MRTEIDHLPAEKRAELAEVVRYLFDGFAETLAARKAPHRASGRILKVILYGSFARNDWVADAAGGYWSDFDLLVVVSDDELSEPVEYWSTADERITRALTVTRELRTPVSFIVHGLHDLNRSLRRGRPFFTTIVREGILLYDVPGHDLEASARLTAEEMRGEAVQHFREWFPSAELFMRAGAFLKAEGGLKEAAFQYHQATERLYHCALLVVSLYSPKSHKLALLRSQAEILAPELIDVWPRSTGADRRPFELLRRAYVEARYSPHFRVSDAELEIIAARVGRLRDAVLALSTDRLAISVETLLG